MECYPSREQVEFKYDVYAVIFGADESLLKINLIDGFSFRKMSLNPNVDKLDKVFDTSAIGLRNKYESARLNQETLDVICAVKTKSYKRSVSGCSDQWC